MLILMASLKVTPIPVWTSNDYVLAVGAMIDKLINKNAALKITVTPVGKGGLHSTVQVAAIVNGRVRDSVKGATRRDPLKMLFPDLWAGLRYAVSLHSVGVSRASLHSVGVSGASLQYIVKKPLVEKILRLHQLKTHGKSKQYTRTLGWINKHIGKYMRFIIIDKDGRELKLGLGNMIPSLAQVQKRRRLAKA